MNNDLISRADLLKKVICHTYPVDILENEHKVITEILRLIGSAPTAELDEWIPITFRQADDEEYKDFIERHDYIHMSREECKVYDCRMPDDGQEVLVTTSSGHVCEDTFCADFDAYGFEYYSDPDDVIAWMPKPKAYKKEDLK